MSRDAHTRKRQYQPSNQTTLNSFLGRGTSLRSPLSPSLDDETQSSLLNVGMRIRKSVPEGYKTHKTLGLSAFPFPASAPAASPSPSTSERPGLNTADSRELMPFCGLHKVGGLGQQAPISSAPAAMRSRSPYEEDDMPMLSMSQRTITSSQNSFDQWPTQTLSTRKRGYEDEADDDMDAFFEEEDFAAALDEVERDATRPVAPMKCSARKLLNGAVRIIDPDDFEEANFLVPMEE
ncbi:putative ribonucleotide reductase inhibitor [Septoria linicola]|nr:putative ribonucleotide reductase inhibitor [Septoria linicola]